MLIQHHLINLYNFIVTSAISYLNMLLEEEITDIVITYNHQIKIIRNNVSIIMISLRIRSTILGFILKIKFVNSALSNEQISYKNEKDENFNIYYYFLGSVYLEGQTTKILSRFSYIYFFQKFVCVKDCIKEF